jgi:hypothetical protein
MRLWKLEEINKAMPLSPQYLRQVTDSTPLAPPRSKDKPADMPPELEPYCEAVFKSSLTSVDAFANSADRSATYADVFSEPWRWRGKVVHFEGTVRRIRHLSAPDMLLGKGIEDLYECWVFGSNDGTRHPVCLVCTELPAGVSLGDDLSLKASFDAYFFKRLLYHAGDSKANEARLAPLFIGRSFLVKKSPTASRTDTDSAEWKSFLIVFLIGVLGTFVLAFGMHWWFRRNDRRVRDRLRVARTRDVTLPEDGVVSLAGASGLYGEPTTPTPDSSYKPEAPARDASYKPEAPARDSEQEVSANTDAS